MQSSSVYIKPVRYRGRRKRITPLKVIVWVLVLAVVTVAGISTYVAWTLTHPNKKAIVTTPDMLGMTFQNIEFQSQDGTTLRGWYLPAKDNDRVVILSHGYRQNRAADKPALPSAQALVDSGISVLMFDFRASGESDGSMTTVGLLERKDMLAAIQYVKSQGYGKTGIGLLGFSMGAATSLMAAADSPDVQAVVADSPFSDLNSYLHENMTHWTKMPDVPFTQIILWELPLIIGHSPSEVSPLGAVEKLRDRPILFIHGGDDQTIANTHSERLVAALAGARSEYWTVSTAGHVGTYPAEPEAYLQRMTEFFMKHLGENKL